MAEITPTQAIQQARELRLADGHLCELEYDVHGNRHSVDCPCYVLAKKLLAGTKYV